jgi:hypothetical protein
MFLPTTCFFRSSSFQIIFLKDKDIIMPVRHHPDPRMWLSPTIMGFAIPAMDCTLKISQHHRGPKKLTKTKNKSIAIGPSNPTGNFKANDPHSLMQMGGRWTTMRRGKGKCSNRRHESAPPAGSDSDE